MTEMEVNRDYNWDGYVPNDIPDYIQQRNELDVLVATGTTENWLIAGPSGCGKTHLAQMVAQRLKAPMFTIQGRYQLYESDLLGHPTIVNGNTYWNDGVLPKALLCSRERLTVLFIDEVNRMRPEASSVLMPILDHRTEVTIDQRGGEVIKGNWVNLVIIATINEGLGYFVQEMDLAAKGRFSGIKLSYLGLREKEKEVNLLMERTGVYSLLASRMVDVANDVRKAAEDMEHGINYGVPTRRLLRWAQVAQKLDGVSDNPVMEAGIYTVANSIYGGDTRQRVVEIIRGKVDGMVLSEQKQLKREGIVDAEK